MKIIAYRADQTKPVIEELPNKLHSMQDFVGGYIETVHLGGNLVLVCDEEGKLKKKPVGWALRIREDKYELLSGNFFVCRENGDEFTDARKIDTRLLSKLIKTYRRMN